MVDLVSPKFLMKLILEIENTLWDLFPTKKYQHVRFYIEKWHKEELSPDLIMTENFIIFTIEDKIDLTRTLHNIDGETLIKIAIDLGIETPDFIPAIPIFRNMLKNEHSSASVAFESAFKKVETEPSLAIGIANSALESIIKEIQKDERIGSKIKKNKTLYDLTSEILKVFNLYPNSDMPEEIKVIGSSLLAVCQSIERLRSDKTDFHGKTNDDYMITDPIYTYFIANCVATIGLFMKSFYKSKCFVENEEITPTDIDELPF